MQKRDISVLIQFELYFPPLEFKKNSEIFNKLSVKNLLSVRMTGTLQCMWLVNIMLHNFVSNFMSSAIAGLKPSLK